MNGQTGKVSTKVLIGIGFTVVVVVLLMWLSGTFHRKIGSPEQMLNATAASTRPLGDIATMTVRRIRVPRTESAVGTVEAKHKIAVASKILASVLSVNASAGQHVSKGDVLARLDDADLVARLEQARAAAKSAKAQRDQAKIEHDRIKALVEQDAAAKIEWDRVQNAYESAQAELDRADQAVNESETVVGYATITSPIDGITIDKQVEAGDTVKPGQILVNLYDPKRMQLVARVRESLTRRLSVGQMIGVRIEALSKTCQGRVSEIVPEAETASRTFSVKVTGPCPPGVYTGMFGRLLIPLEDQPVLVVPSRAISRVGQLELVHVMQDNQLRRRSVKTGRIFDGDTEILAGLQDGERVAVREPMRSDEGGS